MSKAKQEFWCCLIFAVGVIAIGLSHLYVQEQRLKIIGQPIEGGSCVIRAYEFLQSNPPVIIPEPKERPHAQEKTTR